MLDEQAIHVAYIIAQGKHRRLQVLEPTTDAVDAYTEIIRSAPANKVRVNFYSSCTPGYYNGEGKGTRSEDLFFGNRYGGGAMAFYQMLRDWRRENNLAGMMLQ